MIHKSAIDLRFSEINDYLSLICRNYKNLSFQEFHDSPIIFGGDARFIQMIAKHSIDVAAQLLFDLQLEWKEYPQLFHLLETNGIINTATADNLITLSKYYLPDTLMSLKLKDIFEMTGLAETISKAYQSQINGYINNHG